MEAIRLKKKTTSSTVLTIPQSKSSIRDRFGDSRKSAPNFVQQACKAGLGWHQFGALTQYWDPRTLTHIQSSYLSYRSRAVLDP